MNEFTKEKKMFLAICGVVGFTLAFFGTGCVSKKRMEAELAKAYESFKPQLEEALEAGIDRGKEEILEELDKATEQILPKPDLKPIYFDFDKYEPKEIHLVYLNGVELSKRTGKVVISAYCDPRGTEEYNLKLGQKRADAVKEIYQSAGIDSERILTINYGESKQVCQSRNEYCYRLNRKVETELR